MARSLQLQVEVDLTDKYVVWVDVALADALSSVCNFHGFESISF